MRYLSYLLLFSLCVACLSIAGCSQPGQSNIQVQPSKQIEQAIPSPAMQSTSGQRLYLVAVTVQKVGNNMVITYQGGKDTDKLLYSTVSVNGIEQSKRLGNTPGDTITLENVVTNANDHVVVDGHFNDGSTQTILDADLNPSGPIPYRAPTIREIPDYKPNPNPVYTVPVYTVSPYTYRPPTRY
jgi:hypothetical protein